MISMSVAGGFGNEMFQYTFLRTVAERLKTKYACKRLLLDDLFDLKERGRIVSTQCEIPIQAYYQMYTRPGWGEETLGIDDNTVIGGLFESDKFFSSKVKKWFKFKDFVKRYEIDYSQDVMIANKFDISYDNETYYRLPLSYYQEALETLGRGKRAIIFADYPEKAKKFFKKLDIDKVFIDHEDISGTSEALKTLYKHKVSIYRQFYLMTLCRDFIIPSSTFSWWGAYLGKHKDKKVIAPIPWFRPGKTVNGTIYPDSWNELCVRV